MSIDLLNRSYEPTIKELGKYIEGDLSKTFQNFISFVEEHFKAKSQIDYSVCSAQPGWNLKYKKSGRALCTIYPEKTFFIVLVVLGAKEREIFDIVREDYLSDIRMLYDKVRLFNGTKWLMINVTNQTVCEEVIKLLKLKNSKGIPDTEFRVG